MTVRGGAGPPAADCADAGSSAVLTVAGATVTVTPPTPCSACRSCCAAAAASWLTVAESPSWERRVEAAERMTLRTGADTKLCGRMTDKETSVICEKI